MYAIDSNVSQIFNRLFSNVVKNLNILPTDDVINDNVNDPDLINRAILKYEYDTSILEIRTPSHLYIARIKMCFKRLDNYDIFALKLHNGINNSIDHAIFPGKQ